MPLDVTSVILSIPMLFALLHVTCFNIGNKLKKVQCYIISVTLHHVMCFRKMAINYLAFRFWIGMWICLILLLMVAFDLSALVRYITRFTEESFAMLIALIFIYEAFKKLIHILDKSPVDLHPYIPQDLNCSCFPPSIDPDNSSSITSFLSTTLSSVTG